MMKKYEKKIGTELPIKILGDMEPFFNEFKPAFKLKHVLAGAMKMYMALSQEERLAACRDATLEYFVQAEMEHKLNSMGLGDVPPAELPQAVQRAKNALDHGASKQKKSPADIVNEVADAKARAGRGKGHRVG